MKLTSYMLKSLITQNTLYSKIIFTRKTFVRITGQWWPSPNNPPNSSQLLFLFTKYTGSSVVLNALYPFDILQIHCMIRYLLSWNQYPRLKPFCMYRIKQICIIFFIAVRFFSAYTSFCCALEFPRGVYIATQQFSITTELFIVFIKHLLTSLLQNEGSAELWETVH